MAPADIKDRTLSDSTIETLNKIISKEVPVSIYQQNKDTLKKDYGVDLEAVDFILKEKGFLAPETSFLDKARDVAGSVMETIGKGQMEAAKANVELSSGIVPGALEIPGKAKAETIPKPEYKNLFTKPKGAQPEMERAIERGDQVIAGLTGFERGNPVSQAIALTTGKWPSTWAGDWMGVPDVKAASEKAMAKHPIATQVGYIPSTILGLMLYGQAFGPLGAKTATSLGRIPFLTPGGQTMAKIGLSQAASRIPTFATQGFMSEAAKQRTEGGKLEPVGLAKATGKGALWGMALSTMGFIPDTLPRVLTAGAVGAGYTAAEKFATQGKIGKEDLVDIGATAAILMGFELLGAEQTTRIRQAAIKSAWQDEMTMNRFMSSGLSEAEARKLVALDQAVRTAGIKGLEYIKEQNPNMNPEQQRAWTKSWIRMHRSLLNDPQNIAIYSQIKESAQAGKQNDILKQVDQMMNETSIKGLKLPAETKVISGQSLNDLASRIISGDITVAADIKSLVGRVDPEFMQHNLGNLVQTKVSDIAKEKGVAVAQEGLSKIHTAVLNAMKGTVSPADIQAISGEIAQAIKLPPLAPLAGPVKVKWQGQEIDLQKPLVIENVQDKNALKGQELKAKAAGHDGLVAVSPKGEVLDVIQLKEPMKAPENTVEPAKPTIEEKALENYADIPISKVEVIPIKYQDREVPFVEKEVKHITENYDPNLLEPVIVRQTEQGGYQLVSGHNRVEALKRLGKENVPAKIIQTSEDEAVKIARKSNMLRENLSALEEASLFGKETAEGKTPEQVAQIYRRKLSEVQNRLYLNNLGDYPKNMIRMGAMTPEMGQSLGKYAEKFKISPALQMQIFDKLISVEQLTPVELERALEALGPKAVQKVQTGMFEVEKGFIEPMREVNRQIKELNLARRRLGGFIKQVREYQTAGRTIPKAVDKSLRFAQSEVKRLDNSLRSLLWAVARGKLPTAKQALAKPSGGEFVLKPAAGEEYAAEQRAIQEKAEREKALKNAEAAIEAKHEKKGLLFDEGEGSLFEGTSATNIQKKMFAGAGSPAFAGESQVPFLRPEPKAREGISKADFISEFSRAFKDKDPGKYWDEAMTEWNKKDLSGYLKDLKSPSGEPLAAAGESPVPIIPPTPKSQAEALASVQKKIDATDMTKLRAEQAAASELNRKIAKTYRIPDAKARRKEQIELVRKSRIVKFLEEKLMVPIRTGKVGKRMAEGIFKQKQEVVRTKAALDIDTISHEIGHYLDLNLGVISTGDLDKGYLQPKVLPYFNELKAIATRPRKDTKVDHAREGFAEYLRLFITNPAEISKRTPGFNKYFSEILNNNPEIKDILLRARADYKRWLQLPSVSRILSQISIKTEGGMKSPGEMFSEFYTACIDDLNPIKEYVKVARKAGVKFQAQEDPYILARLMRGWYGKADTFLRDTTFDVNFNEKGKPLNKILSPIKEAGQLDDLRVYLIARRALELSKRGIKSGLYQTDALQAIKELDKKYPEFTKVAQEIGTYQDTLLTYAKDSGLISEQNFAKIKKLNQEYVPFFRVIEEAQRKGLAGKTLANVTAPVKRIKGSGREIIDPLESIVKNTYAMINAAERNRITLSIVKLAAKHKDLGQLVEKIPVPMAKAATINLVDEIKKALKDAGVESIGGDEIDGALVDVFRPSMFAGDNTIWVMRDGKKEYYQVDPDLYRGLMALDQENMGMLLKIASIPAKLLRAGATLTPDFIMRNPMRDQLSAFIYSKYGYVPMVNLVSGIWSMITGDKSYRAWRISGGEHSMLVSLDREYLQKNLSEIMANAKEKLGNLVIHPIDALRMMSELMEAGTRIGEFKMGIRKEGWTPEGKVKAGYASRGVTLDFARIGAKTKAINALIAFFNAQVQGTDKMIRSFKAHPLKTLIKALISLTLPSILLYLVNRDDPEYQEIPRWQKDLFWLVKINGVYWRIPKPFEIAILWGTVPERILEAIDKKDPEKVTELFTDLSSSLYQGLSPGVLPTFMQAPIENVANWSFFQNRPLVPYWKTDMPPSEQYGKWESPTSKMIGKKLGISPAKITNIVQGYTGGMGKYALQGVDWLGEKIGLYQERPKLPTEAADIPGIKAFAVRKPTGFNSESVMEFYKRYRTTIGYKMALKKIKDEQGPIAQLEYFKSMPKDIRNDLLIWETYQSAYNQIKKLSDQRDMIYEAKGLSPERKQAALDKIDKALVTWARLAIKVSDRVRSRK